MNQDIKELRLDVANKTVEMQSSFAQAVRLVRERHGLEAAKPLSKCNSEVLMGYAVPRLNELLLEAEHARGVIDAAVIGAQIEVTFAVAEDMFLKRFAELRQMIANGTLEYQSQIERWNLQFEVQE